MNLIKAEGADGDKRMGTGSLLNLLALLPVAVLLGLLAFFHVRAHLAALAALLTSGAIAVGVL